MKKEKVIIRTNKAGIFFGEIASLDEVNQVARLTNVRRLWYWSGAASLSQMCMEGVKFPENCKFSMTVPSMTVFGVIEVLPCTEKAVKSIEGVGIWKI